jgi:hypothetical protein
MPGPSFTRPPVTDTGEAYRRAMFVVLLRRRIDHLHTEGDDAVPEDLLDALVLGFVDSVERANSSRAILRQQPLDYVDAVLIEGTGGHLVVDAVEYDTAPVHWQAKAGEVTSVVHGADLDAYLRTGDQTYAERLGLA